MKNLQIGFKFFIFQFPGKVDLNSPAAAAGLKAQDIIIEINGNNVTRENHKQIVDRIKSSGDSTTFLVVDEQCKVSLSYAMREMESISTLTLKSLMVQTQSSKRTNNLSCCLIL